MSSWFYIADKKPEAHVTTFDRDLSGGGNGVCGFPKNVGYGTVLQMVFESSEFPHLRFVTLSRALRQNVTDAIDLVKYQESIENGHPSSLDLVDRGMEDLLVSLGFSPVVFRPRLLDLRRTRRRNPPDRFLALAVEFREEEDYWLGFKMGQCSCEATGEDIHHKAYRNFMVAESQNVDHIINKAYAA